MNHDCFYAVYEDRITKGKTIEDVNCDNEPLFYVGRTRKVSYSYGSFYEWVIVDRFGDNSRYTLGSYTLKKFYNSGQQTDHRLVIEIEDENGIVFNRIFHQDRRYGMHPDYLRHPEPLWENDWDYETACEIARDTMSKLETISAEDLLLMDQYRNDAFQAKRTGLLLEQENGRLREKLDVFKDSIVELKIPEGVEEISYDQFECCSQLRKATLPQTIKTIGICAFNLCPALEEIEIKSIVPPKSGLKFPEEGCNRCKAKVTVSKDCLEEYRNSKWWGSYCADMEVVGG